MNSYLEKLEYLLDKYGSATKLAADIGTCERSLKRWLREGVEPIHRYKVRISQLWEEVNE